MNSKKDVWILVVSIFLVLSLFSAISIHNFGEKDNKKNFPGENKLSSDYYTKPKFLIYEKKQKDEEKLHKLGNKKGINILNVQSYPNLDGNWAVQFNTIGIANLTITTMDETSWTNYSDTGNDLKFLEIKCGNNTLNYSWIENGPANSSVFIENYSCNETGYEISKVLTVEKHHLEFDFGGQKAYAHNDILIKVPTTCGDLVFTDAHSWEAYTNWTIPGSGKINVTQILYWQHDNSLSSSESIEMAIYNSSSPYSRISEIVTLDGTGESGWISANLSQYVEIDRGKSYFFGMGPSSVDDGYNMSGDYDMDCSNYPPISDGSYLQSASSGLDSNVPTGSTHWTHKVGIIGIAYESEYTDVKVPMSCSYFYFTDAQNIEWYSNWTIPGSGEVELTKLWLWQINDNLSSTESVKMAIYNSFSPYSKISEIVTLNGTGVASEWISKELQTPVNITLGESYFFGIGPGNGAYDLGSDSNSDCSDYPPSQGSYYVGASGNLNDNVPTGGQSTSHKAGIIGITYKELDSGDDNTCTPPGSGDWSVLCSDNCTLSDQTIAISGALIVYGSDSGILKFNNVNLTVQDFRMNATSCKIAFKEPFKFIKS